MKNKEAILAAIAYSDIFDSPLTLEQIHTFYQGESKATQDDIKKIIFQIPEIERKENYFFLKGRHDLVMKKKFRKMESEKKLQKAKIIAKCLSLIPTIQLIAVSGSLATKNAGHEDDIDLFIVAKADTVWITRLLIHFFLIVTFQKRKKNVRSAPDKICPNMIISEDALATPPHSRTLYTAREIAQIYPLVEKNNTYSRLLHANKWVLKILPNVGVPQAPSYSKPQQVTKFLKTADSLLFVLQKRYMKITNETVSKKIAKFHPRKTSEYVHFLYKKRLEMVLGERNAKQITHQHDQTLLIRRVGQKRS